MDQAAQPGPATFEQVVLPHLDSAYGVARWLMGDAALAEDVAQEAALRALRHFGTYRGGNARAWLLRIVHNVAHDTWAARRAQPLTSLDAEREGPALHVPDPGETPEQALSRAQDHATLADALARLPPPLRTCLVLRELEELSYREIAEVTGVPVGTVMSRLWRARQMLLRWTEDRDGR